MGILIDSSVLIAAERGDLDVDQVLATPDWQNETVGIAAVTASEMLHGVHRLAGVPRVRAEAFARRWLDVLPVFTFDLEVARVHATLGAQLAAAGTPIGAHDLMIAATAVRHGYGVATWDRRSYSRIEGLRVEYW